MKVSLIQAGLGAKNVVFSDVSCNSEEFRHVVERSYPKLEGCGGFELLRCIPNTKQLEVISSNIAQSPKLLKSFCGNGKIYIRPIQKNLDLSLDESLVLQEEVSHCLSF